MDFTHIIKYGNSHYVLVSVAYMSRLNLKKGDPVTVELTEKGLLVKKLDLSREGENNKTRENDRT